MSADSIAVAVISVILITGVACLFQIRDELRFIRSMIAKELLRQKVPESDE